MQHTWLAVSLVVILSGSVGTAHGWELQNPQPGCWTIADCQVLPDGFGVAVGRGGAVLTTPDSAHTWETHQVPTPTDLQAVWVGAWNAVWVCGGVAGFGYTAYSENGGVTWKETGAPGGVGTVHTDICRAPDGNIWVCTEGTTDNLFWSDDNGLHWHHAALPQARLYLVEFDDHGHGVAGGRMSSPPGSILYVTSDTGRTWTTSATFPDSLTAARLVSWSAAQTWYVAGYNGIARTDNAGGLWRTVLALGEMQILNGMHFASPDSGVVFSWTSGAGQRALVTGDGGSAWGDYPVNVCAEVDVYVPHGGIAQGVLFTTPYSLYEWNLVDATPVEVSTNTGSDMLAIDFANAQVGCAVSQESACSGQAEMYWTSDGGSTWTASPCPVPTATRLVCLGEGIALVKGAAVTYDAGETWTQTGFAASWVSGGIPGVSGGAFVVTNEGVSVTRDTARNWSTAPLPHGTGVGVEALCFADSLVAYALGPEEYPLRRTTDGGMSWVDLNDGISQQMKARLIDFTFVDSLFGWAYGGQLEHPLIYVTRDGGNSWEQQTSIDTLWSGTQPADRYQCYVRKIVAQSAATAWALAPSNHVFCTTDSGAHWVEVSVDEGPGRLDDIAVARPLGVWVCGRNNAILYADAGTAATHQPLMRAGAAGAHTVFVNVTTDLLGRAIVGNTPSAVGMVVSGAGRTRATVPTTGNSDEPPR